MSGLTEAAVPAVKRCKCKGVGEIGMRHLSAMMKAALVLGIVACASTSGSAQTVEGFYRSHQITLISSSGPGSGYDVYSRLLAQYMARHIPGEPRIIVQNMEGAGGLTPSIMSPMSRRETGPSSPTLTARCHSICLSTAAMRNSIR
jgi:hypothetical protein